MSLGRSKSEQAATNVRIYNRRYWRTHKYLFDRTEYMRNYYRQHREKKLAAAKARQANGASDSLT